MKRGGYLPNKEIEQKIIDNEKLVYFVVSKHFPAYYTDEDIIQCGRIGLWRACKNFNNDKSAFSTFATACIHNEIAKELRNRNRKRNSGYTVSLDQVVGTEKDTGSDITFGQIIPCDEEGYSLVDYDLSAVEKKLSKQQVKIFKMYIDGFNIKEISEIYGFSRQRASQIIKDAQGMARKVLKERKV